jgi:hypothetical protein
VKAPEGFASSIVLGSPSEKAYDIGVDKSKTFSITQGPNKYIMIDKDGAIVLRTNKLTAASFDATDAFLVGPTRQWGLAVHETFPATSKPKGWSNGAKPVTSISNSQCSGISMLGGYELFSGGEVNKVFDKLKNHTQIRVEANFHCIDLWSGESGYMMLDNGLAGEMEYAWTSPTVPSSTIPPRNVCGNAEYGESRFTNKIDVTIPHTKPSIKIAFGSTLEGSSAAFWGVSSLKIYTR